MEKQFFIGSICLTDIPKELIKKAANGKMYLNIAVGTRVNKESGQPEANQFGHTHYISCSPKKEERVEGKNYFIGDLKLWNPTPQQPTAEDIAAAPVITQEEADNLPF